MTVQPPSPELWTRLAALDARADLTMHRAEFFPPRHEWISVKDERGTVRGAEPTQAPLRQWIVTVRLRAGQMHDVVQARGASFNHTVAEACAAAEARGWHLSVGDRSRRPA